MLSGDGKGGMKGVLAPEGLSYNMLDIQRYISVLQIDTLQNLGGVR